MSCRHATPTTRAAPRAAACEGCGIDHQLRVCNGCGHVGCADSHQGHATAHAAQEGHAVFRELTPDDRPDDGWTWCHACGDYVG